MLLSQSLEVWALCLVSLPKSDALNAGRAVCAMKRALACILDMLFDFPHGAAFYHAYTKSDAPTLTASDFSHLALGLICCLEHCSDIYILDIN